MAVQRARAEEKHAVSSTQQEASIANRVTTYQAKIDQSIGRWVRRDVKARTGPKSDRWPWERKNSVA